VSDALRRWAAERAPELAKRAEAEAVALLRDALVVAATRERKAAERTTARPARPPDSPPEGPRPRDSRELLWAYCVVSANARLPEDLAGLAASRPVRKVVREGVAALVSPVPASEFGAEPLRENLNDLAWLERVARAHEDVLERVFTGTTIVPLRMCTIYESEARVAAMLEREHGGLTEALAALEGQEEWGVKLLVDPERLRDAARTRDDEARRLEDELDGRSGGEAYMLRRRVERRVSEVADSLGADVASDVHARLQDWASDAVTRPPQNRELSGHSGEMLLNGSYLVDSSRVDGLRELVSELEQRHGALGARIELTGPWPPFNFVPGATVAALG
jgi:hypothetical protein